MHLNPFVLYIFTVSIIYLCSGFHEAACKRSNGCPVCFDITPDKGLFTVKPVISTYDINRGYDMLITLTKGVPLVEGTAPFVPDQIMISEYLKKKGIMKAFRHWALGYVPKMYMPYAKAYNLQKIVFVKEVTIKDTRNGPLELLEATFICGIPGAGNITLSLWGQNALSMHATLR